MERYNKTLIEALSMQMEREDQTDWENWISMALFAYRSTPHSTTGYTPFQLHLGRQPRTPFDTLADSLMEAKTKTAVTYLKELQQVVKIQQKQVQAGTKAAMESRKVYYDRKINYHTYSKGDLVLCRDYTCKPGLKPKLMKERWTGPWIVDNIRGPVNYRIKKKNKKDKWSRVLVHHDRLKKFHQRQPMLEKDPTHLLSEPVEVAPETGEGSTSDSEPTDLEPLGEDSEDEYESTDEGEEVMAGPGLPRERAESPERMAQARQENINLPNGEYVTLSGRRSKPPRCLIDEM